MEQCNNKHTKLINMFYSVMKHQKNELKHSFLIISKTSGVFNDVLPYKTMCRSKDYTRNMAWTTKRTIVYRHCISLTYFNHIDSQFVVVEQNTSNFLNEVYIYWSYHFINYVFYFKLFVRLFVFKYICYAMQVGFLRIKKNIYYT